MNASRMPMPPRMIAPSREPGTGCTTCARSTPSTAIRSCHRRRTSRPSGEPRLRRDRAEIAPRSRREAAKSRLHWPMTQRPLTCATWTTVHVSKICASTWAQVHTPPAAEPRRVHDDGGQRLARAVEVLVPHAALDPGMRSVGRACHHDHNVHLPGHSRCPWTDGRARCDRTATATQRACSAR